MTIEIDRQSRKAIVEIKGLKKSTKYAVDRASWTSGNGLIKETSAEILKKPKGGRVYTYRDALGRRRRHKASAPGETHANLSGRLRRSLSFKVRTNQLEFGYGVQKTDAPDYAESVEFGTNKMAARPSLQNGIRSQRRNFQNNFEREISKKIRKPGIIK